MFACRDEPGQVNSVVVITDINEVINNLKGAYPDGFNDFTTASFSDRTPIVCDLDTFIEASKTYNLQYFIVICAFSEQSMYDAISANAKVSARGYVFHTNTSTYIVQCFHPLVFLGSDVDGL